MSALGQKQTCAVQEGMSALPPRAVEIADIVCREEQSTSALPGTFKNVDLLRHGEGIAQINAENAQCSLS